MKFLLKYCLYLSLLSFCTDHLSCTICLYQFIKKRSVCLKYVLRLLLVVLVRGDSIWHTSVAIDSINIRVITVRWPSFVSAFFLANFSSIQFGNTVKLVRKLSNANISLDAGFSNMHCVIQSVEITFVRYVCYVELSCIEYCDSIFGYPENEFLISKNDKKSPYCFVISHSKTLGIRIE